MEGHSCSFVLGSRGLTEHSEHVLLFSYKCRHINLFYMILYFLTVFYTLNIYRLCVWVYRILMDSCISRFGMGVNIFLTYTFFINLLPHFCTSVSPFFLPVLSSHNTLPSNHTALKSVFLKVNSYNDILTFFPKGRYERKKIRSLQLYHTCRPENISNEAKIYISLHKVAAIFPFSILLYIHSLDYLMIFYVRLTQMCLFSLMSYLR